MQTSMLTRIPAAVYRKVGEEHTGVRFRQIGPYPKFWRVRERFLSEFLWADWKEIEGVFWWIIPLPQIDELKDFCQRNHLKLFEEIKGNLHER